MLNPDQIQILLFRPRFNGKNLIKKQFKNETFIFSQTHTKDFQDPDVASSSSRKRVLQSLNFFFPFFGTILTCLDPDPNI